MAVTSIIYKEEKNLTKLKIRVATVQGFLENYNILGLL